jgi:hypothetical protein
MSDERNWGLLTELVRERCRLHGIPPEAVQRVEYAIARRSFTLTLYGEDEKVLYHSHTKNAIEEEGL